MKNIPFLLFSLLGWIAFAQDSQKTFNHISEAEAKSALKRLSFKANVNTGNYDLKYHRLEFTLDPAVASISGEITSYFEAKSNLSQITFDLSDNMVVSQVTYAQNGSALSFVQNANDELIIDLPAVQNSGVLDSLTVTYSGNPVDSGLDSYVLDQHSGDPIVWTLSEPYGAKGWWPCKQDLNDKIDSIDVFVTTPKFNPSNEEYIAVSNGLEQSQVDNGPDKTTHFKHRYPIPAYLIAIAVTNYEVYSETVANNGNPFDIVNYVYPENLSTAQTETPVTVDIMNLYTNLFEEYPFSNEKYGHAQFGTGGGMEHTTVSFMGNFSRNLIAHELAHQWFGNKITCGSWKDIWLNEGFASYLSGLVIENFNGANTFNNWKKFRINFVTTEPDGSVYLKDADTTDVSRIFSTRLTYRKGAIALHMLRKQIGDTDFFQGVKDYLNSGSLAYNYAKTEDFKAVMEAASGEDLTEFFNDWIYNEGYPIYNIEWNQSTANQVQINISQSQSDASVSFFEAPVPLRLHGTLGETLDVVLFNTLDNEVFLRSVNFNVESVEFDPEGDLLSRNSTVTLSTKETDFISKLIVFPNTDKTQLTVIKPRDLVISKAQVFNISGQLLYNSKQWENINISSYPLGVFFVRLHTNKGLITKSVLKN